MFHLKVLQHFKKILKSSCTGLKDGYTCLEFDCIVCDQFKQQNVKAYINKTTGLFSCPNCNLSENGENIIRIYDNECPSEEKTKLRQRINQLIQNVGTFWNNRVNSTVEASRELVKSKLNILPSPSVWQSLEVRYQPDSNLLYFPLKNAAGLVVGEKIMNLTKLELEETHPENGCSGVLLHKPVKSHTAAVIVPTLVDFLILVSQDIDDVSIVCFPYWNKVLPQECLPALDRFKKIIFWFDFDKIGWDVGRNFVRELDEKRCFFIRNKPLSTTPLETIKKHSLKNIILKAEPVKHKSITTFVSLKQDILFELKNVEKVDGIKWKRFPILNKLLKGHRKGELTVITGTTGSGKTTFMSEYSLDLAMQGVSTLWGSFEIKNTKLASTLLQQFVGYSLENKLDEFEYWANQFQKLPLFFMTFHGQQSINVVMQAIDHAQSVYGINHVIIDNVQFMMGISTTSKYDKFWEQDAVIAAFRTFCTSKNVHVSLVMHPRKERECDLTINSIFGSAKAVQEADNVLIIQDKSLSSIKGKKYLQVAKNRYSGDLGIMPMEFDRDGLTFVRKAKKKID